MKAQSVVAATVGILLATVLLSGPLLSVVDLTSERTFSGEDLGEGRVTVANATLPDGAVLERGDFGAGSYYLRVPAASVELREVVGRPILSYELSIPALGKTRSSIAVLSSSSEGVRTLTLDEGTFGRDEITNESYDARLSLDVRYGGREHPIASKNVTVEVVG